MEKIIIENFGPVSYFEAEVKDVMIFIGPQASGKSTIAKLIFFFKSVKNFLIDFINNVIKQSDLPTTNNLIEEFKKNLSRNLSIIWWDIDKNPPFKIKYYYSDNKFIEFVPLKQKFFYLD